MNSILTFNFEPLEESKSVMPFVDGVPLSVLVETFERAHGYSDPAGGYAGLVPEFSNFGPLDDYFLRKGTSAMKRSDGTLYFLGCQCGELECWPLVGHITKTAAIFQWHGFFNPYRPLRDYSTFGPFRFEQAAYESATEVLRALFSRG